MTHQRHVEGCEEERREVGSEDGSEDTGGCKKDPKSREDFAEQFG